MTGGKVHVGHYRNMNNVWRTGKTLDRLPDRGLGDRKSVV